MATSDLSLDDASQRAFTCFSKLSLDLRTCVWKTIAFIPRIIDVWPKSVCNIERKNRESEVDETIYRYVTTQPPPKILQVSKESQNVGLKYYSLELGFALDEPRLSRLVMSLPPRTYVNYHADMICLMGDFPHQVWSHFYRMSLQKPINRSLARSPRRIALVLQTIDDLKSLETWYDDLEDTVESGAEDEPDDDPWRESKLADSLAKRKYMFDFIKTLNMCEEIVFYDLDVKLERRRLKDPKRTVLVSVDFTPHDEQDEWTQKRGLSWVARNTSRRSDEERRASASRDVAVLVRRMKEMGDVCKKQVSCQRGYFEEKYLENFEKAIKSLKSVCESCVPSNRVSIRKMKQRSITLN